MPRTPPHRCAALSPRRVRALEADGIGLSGFCDGGVRCQCCVGTGERARTEPEVACVVNPGAADTGAEVPQGFQEGCSDVRAAEVMSGGATLDK
eukprot:3397248-Rhodomonas_salina.1